MNTNAQEVANTIRSQLGNGKFVAMTGAKNFAYGTNEDGPYLSFHLPNTRNNIKAKYVRITLTIMDTYAVAFLNRKGETLRAFESVYADALQATFTEVTGLETSLGWNDGPFK